MTFRTRHLFGLAPVRGTFAIQAGAADIAWPPGQSAVYAEIETASFRTKNSQRDQSVLSPRFLDAGGYPVITFTAGSVDAASAVIAGTLTVRGNVRPVTLSVVSTEVSTESVTVTAATRIDRFDFGITAARGLAARYLRLSVTVTCVRRNEGAGHD